MTLVPVGPGGALPGSCSTPAAPTGYAGKMTVVCNFDNVAVNTHLASVTVDGGYYTGAGEDVLVVYDPSLGFTTGGGWLYWPGTNERTNFGYTMKYNKKGIRVQDSLLLIRHLPDESIYRVKSNALYRLALGDDPSVPMGWASFSGKATYLQPGWSDPEANHQFLVYVEDRGEPGTGVDRFWIEVRDKDNNVVSAMSMSSPAPDNTTLLNGGNIVVPHETGGRGKGPKEQLARQTGSDHGRLLRRQVPWS